MTCAICREPIPDDAPVIETLEGENLCEACHEERLEDETEDREFCR